MEFVEVRGKTTEVAVEAALGELGLTSIDEAEVEVIDPGKKGFLGVGGSDAIVRVRPKPKPRPKRRRRRRGGDKSEGASSDGEGRGRPQAAGQAARGGREQQRRGQQPAKQGGRPDGEPRQQPQNQPAKAQAPATEPADTAEVQGQAVESFLKGLVGAFGIEAGVEVTTSADGVSAAVTGEQAEALVGEKGAVMQAVQEVTRTVVQRRFHDPARVRVDVAGYNERRRQALGIYAERLAEQVKSEGGEIMLEPMNAADRKVVHDAISAIEGVKSYSEGEDPRRCVVISAD